MGHRGKAPRQPLRAWTGLHADLHLRRGIEKRHQRVARELRALDHRSGSVQSDDVEDLLANVDAEGRYLWVRFGAHPFSPLGGVVPLPYAGVRGGPSH
jgi:hypothetical protein